jgi:hypothetical protein
MTAIRSSVVLGLGTPFAPGPQYIWNPFAKSLGDTQDQLKAEIYVLIV